MNDETMQAGELAYLILGAGYEPRVVTVDDAHAIAAAILVAGYRKVSDAA